LKLLSPLQRSDYICQSTGSAIHRGIEITRIVDDQIRKYQYEYRRYDTNSIHFILSFLDKKPPDSQSRQGYYYQCIRIHFISF
jgi:hypothetical protein